MSETENEREQEPSAGQEQESSAGHEHHEHAHRHHSHHHHHHSHRHTHEHTAEHAEESAEEHSGGHSHGHHHRHQSKGKTIAYSILSFFLAFGLFLLSACAVLQTTVFSKDYMLNIMRNNGYYDMVRAELESCMEDLADASGFEKAFADNFVSGYDVQKAVEDYVGAFYSGDKTIVDTTLFKQKLYQAVEDYAAEKGLTIRTESESSIGYFVDEAAAVYTAQISIPFFGAIANYIFKLKSILTAVTIGLGVFVLVIAAIIFFTNQYKHRRFRYLFIGTAGSALTIAVLPTAVFIADIIRKVNLTTRSVYNLFVSYFNGFFSSFYLWAGIMAALSVMLFLLYVKYYRRAVS